MIEGFLSWNMKLMAIRSTMTVVLILTAKGNAYDCRLS